MMLVGIVMILIWDNCVRCFESLLAVGTEGFLNRHCNSNNPWPGLPSNATMGRIKSVPCECTKLSSPSSPNSSPGSAGYLGTPVWGILMSGEKKHQHEPSLSVVLMVINDY